MKKLVILAIFLGSTIVFANCNTPEENKQELAQTDSKQPDSPKVDTHNARNSLDWNGIYRDTIPCADCEGILAVITLEKDLKYQAQSKYLGKADSIFESSGTFTWNNAGNMISLNDIDKRGGADQYFVSENSLIKLDKSGNRITGELANKYVLRKLNDPVLEKYWKLVELSGKPIGANDKLNKEPHVIFKAFNNRIVGNSSCNSFTASYELKDMHRVKISKLASTRMACPEMSVESGLLRVLNTVDNYDVNDTMLTLNRARMAPLARFRVVYLR